MSKDNSQSAKTRLVNEQPWGIIYENSLVYAALIGFVPGAALFGYLGWAMGAGVLSIGGLGQFAASGAGVALFVGAGTGGVLGAFAGAILALIQLSRKNRH